MAGEEKLPRILGCFNCLAFLENKRSPGERDSCQMNLSLITAHNKKGSFHNEPLSNDYDKLYYFTSWCSHLPKKSLT